MAEEPTTSPHLILDSLWDLECSYFLTHTFLFFWGGYIVIKKKDFTTKKTLIKRENEMKENERKIKI